MARITVEDCLKQVPNRFQLSHVAMRRAKQILRGAKSKFEGRGNKPVVMALREVACGDVRMMTPEEQEALKKKASVDPFQVPEGGFDESLFSLESLGYPDADEPAAPNGSNKGGSSDDDEEDEF